MGTMGPYGVDDAQMQTRLARFHQRSQPPQNQVPGIFVVRQVIASSATTHIVLLEVRTYTTGLRIEVALHGRAGQANAFGPTDPRMAERLGVPPATSPSITIAATDGTHAAVLRGRELFDQLDDVADLPVLFMDGGDGNNQHLTLLLWLTPFPIESLHLGVEWLAQGIEATDFVLNLTDLDQARRHITELWPWRLEDELHGLDL